jgi:predicted nucleic acid-binding protein
LIVASCFLDTNILLYAAAHQAQDVDEPKHELALQIVRDGDFAISAQVLQEFYVNAIKLKPTPLAAGIAEKWVESLCEMECIAVDDRLVKEGIAISRRFRTSYWDGAIIAAAHAAGVDAVYTEDLSHRQNYGSVTAINPFKSQSH